MNPSLVWGEPPEDAPEAGKIVPPKKIENTPGSDQAGKMSSFQSFGVKIPLWGQVRHVLRVTRGYEKPFKVDCGDMGWLYVGDEGWKLEKETHD